MNVLEYLEQNHPRRYKIAKELVEKLEMNDFKRSSVNLWEKSSRRESKTITLMVDGFEVYVREYPAKEGWSRRKEKYTKAILSHKNSMMFCVSR